MKVPIRNRVNAKHNFTTTQEMKEVLEWYGGIRGYGAAVVEFDTPKEVSKDGKSAGINILRALSIQPKIRGNFSWKSNGTDHFGSFRPELIWGHLWRWSTLNGPFISVG